MDKWEECQDMVEQMFGEKPETPMELVQIMVCMADTILDLRQGRKESEASQKLHLS